VVIQVIGVGAAVAVGGAKAGGIAIVRVVAVRAGIKGVQLLARNATVRRAAFNVGQTALKFENLQIRTQARFGSMMLRRAVINAKLTPFQVFKKDFPVGALLATNVVFTGAALIGIVTENFSTPTQRKNLAQKGDVVVINAQGPPPFDAALL